MQKTKILIILSFFLLFFMACSNDKKNTSKTQNTVEEIIQIEQNDEKTELSDSNLPLPVDDEMQTSKNTYEVNLSVISSLYKQKCASCHGEKGELQINHNPAIKTLNNKTFIQKIKILKDKNHSFLTQEQIYNLADFINKGKL
ncbi:cytochrome c [Campylobacter hepaticus]|uniref:Cytochrome c n=1 Tax=Campylobacter hepaticus TaxID=1813019 RepID=A0A424Z0Z7_9BACT|nr:cytochrome c [Campylobacter hepaticus]AXP09110.1 cytochrome c [Campylobacter hepaticus]MCZ0771602.1 cytochrome c [Campylobacter hepaticus]MCZ0773070.1 cytochrome c [Campylobacter hepaticus]MCZ0775750.1 cytochrome c [Campylobacter hepaticus]MDX2323471.1 cytochrome c [Campylobacter hepaticus]